MTDDTTSIPTVGDDEIGSSEDREVRPLSSTINPSPQHGGGFSIWNSSKLRRFGRSLFDDEPARRLQLPQTAAPMWFTVVANRRGAPCGQMVWERSV